MPAPLEVYNFFVLCPHQAGGGGDSGAPEG